MGIVKNFTEHLAVFYFGNDFYYGDLLILYAYFFLKVVTFLFRDIYFYIFY
jgi:hypothetical protein